MEQGYELILSNIRKMVLDEVQNTTLYIPLQGKYTTNSEEEPFDLGQKINKFFVFEDSNPSDPKVMLLMGDTGSGKSMFAQQLFQQLWKMRKEGDPIPLWIPLPELLSPFESAVEEVLKKYEFSESQIAEMKGRERFIFVVDGYDELHQFQNCYVTNNWDRWNAKVLITCRSQALYYQKDPDKYFVAFNGEKRLPWLLRKLYVASFSQDQIKVYVEAYNHRIPAQDRGPANKKQEPAIKFEDFDKVPGLKELISTPFLLHLTAEALPDILAEQKAGEENQKITQAKLYDVFIERWFTRQVKKLQTAGQLKDGVQKTKQQFWDYCKRLALEMHAKNISVVPCTPQKAGGRLFGKSEKKNTWEAFFNEETEVLRSACPLKRIGDHHYGFIHASLVEYFAMRAMYEEIQEQEERVELCEEEKEEINIESLSVIKKPKGDIHHRVFAKEPNAIRNLADRIEMEDTFKRKMLIIVEKSKTSEQYSTGAANAITALVRAGVTFNYADLSGIRISGADVSGGYFAGVNLRGSDLRDVVLAKTYLLEANLRGCQLAGIHFHEYPWLMLENGACARDYRSDLNRLVTTSMNDINIWDTLTMKCIKVLNGQNKVFSAKFSGDGRQVVSISIRDMTVRVWDVVSGETTVLLGHEGFVECVQFSEDGRQVVSGSKDKTVRVWDIESKEAKVLRGHKETVRSVWFNGNGRQMMSGSRDGTVRVWDVVSGEAKVLCGHERCVSSVQLSSDGRQLVSGGEDKTVRVWDLANGAVKVLHGHEGMVISVQFSGDGLQVVSGGEDKTIRLWDVASGRAKVLRGHEGCIMFAQFSADERQVVSSGDNTVRVWDVVSGETRVLRGHEGSVGSVQFSRDGRHVVSGSSDKTVRVWEVVSGQGKVLCGHEGNIESVQFNGNERQVVSVSWDNTVRVWNVESGTAKILRGHEGMADSAQFSPDGLQLVSVSIADNTVRVWDVMSERVKILRGHEDDIESVQFSSDGRQVVSGSVDKTVRVWDVMSGKARVFRGHEGSVNCLQFSPDGQQVVSACWDNTLRVWDVVSGTAMILHGHEGKIRCVQFSSDGRQVVSGSDDNTVRVWEVASGHAKVLRAHQRGVNSVQFSRDGRQVVSSSYDKTIRVWENECESEVRCISFYAPPRDISLHEERGLLCVGLEDGTVQCWQRIDASWASLRLLWNSNHPNDTLLLKGCDTQGSEGLSMMNRRLLEQRGAIIDANQDSETLAISSELITQVARRSGSPLHQSPRDVSEQLEEYSSEVLK